MCIHKPTQSQDTDQNCHRLADVCECCNFTVYKLRQKGDSHTHTHTRKDSKAITQCWRMAAVLRYGVWGSPAGRENRENNRDAFGGFWLFSCVWEDGCDNCYLGGEQRKRLHQGKAGHPEAGETWSSRTNTSGGQTVRSDRPVICYTKPGSFKSSIFTLFCFVLSYGLQTSDWWEKEKQCLVIPPPLCSLISLPSCFPFLSPHILLFSHKPLSSHLPLSFRPPSQLCSHLWLLLCFPILLWPERTCIPLSPRWLLYERHRWMEKGGKNKRMCWKWCTGSRGNVSAKARMSQHFIEARDLSDFPETETQNLYWTSSGC